MAGLQATFIIFLNFSTVNLVLLLQKKIILKIYVFAQKWI